MENKIQGYFTELLIPLPPYPELVSRVRKKAVECFIKEPLYYRCDIFEGYLIPWRTWYGFDGENEVKVGRFRSYLEMQLDDFFKDDYEKEALFIEWISENNFEYIDITDHKKYSEVFSNRYENGNASITFYSNFLRISLENRMIDIDFDNFSLMRDWMRGDALPIFEKLKRRGIYG